ncbi:MAG: hypothetical protein ACK2TU_06910, partial [Anaerolineales bacterium]
PDLPLCFGVIDECRRSVILGHRTWLRITVVPGSGIDECQTVSVGYLSRISGTIRIMAHGVIQDDQYHETLLCFSVDGDVDCFRCAGSRFKCR